MNNYQFPQKHQSSPAENMLFHKFINEVKDYAIFIMDTSGHITNWNQGAQAIKGYTAEEITGKHYRILFPDDKREEGKAEQELQHAITYGRYEDEAWRKKKNGDLFWAYVVLTAIHNEQGEVTSLIKITRDLTDRKKAEDALYRQNEKLIKVNADLDNFVYTASHDLKSPVLNIAGLVDALEQEIEPEKHEKIRRYIKESVKRLQNTIDELTDITRVNKDLEEGNEEPVSFESILEDVKYSMTNKLREDCPEIYTDFRVEKIHFSKLNLKSILLNLMSNAIKYRSADRNCFIRIATYQEENYVVLKVEDKGIGMPKGFKEKVFKMFTRLHTHVDGSGVGLYIIKRIVDNADGKIEVDSEVEKGTTFRIYLPQKVLSPKADPAKKG